MRAAAASEGGDGEELEAYMITYNKYQLIVDLSPIVSHLNNYYARERFLDHRKDGEPIEAMSELVGFSIVQVDRDDGDVQHTFAPF